LVPTAGVLSGLIQSCTSQKSRIRTTCLRPWGSGGSPLENHTKLNTPRGCLKPPCVEWKGSCVDWATEGLGSGLGRVHMRSVSLSPNKTLAERKRDVSVLFGSRQKQHRHFLHFRNSRGWISVHELDPQLSRGVSFGRLDTTRESAEFNVELRP